MIAHRVYADDAKVKTEVFECMPFEHGVYVARDVGLGRRLPCPRSCSLLRPRVRPLSVMSKLMFPKVIEGERTEDRVDAFGYLSGFRQRLLATSCLEICLMYTRRT